MKSLLLSSAFVAVTTVLATFALLFVHAGTLDDLHMFNYQPKANSKNIVLSGDGKARFTVLSPYVIRMEYSAGGTFEDRATLAIVNRGVPAVHFTQQSSGSELTITTSHIKLSYQSGGSDFGPGNLQIDSLTGAFSTYKFGDQDTQNLLGSIRSLDDHCTIPLNCDQNTGIQTNGENLHCAWGVVSRGGWTTINDTANFIMGQGPSQPEWFARNARAVSNTDIYFFGHGLNYKAAVADFSAISGKMPIPSRPLLGAWFTRWFDYDQSDLERLLDVFRQNSIPLDVLILDMNWHKKDAWTGWTWDTQLFPFPESTLETIRKRGLMTGANVHDAQGVHDWEKLYKQFCEAVGVPASTNTPINFQPLNATYMRSVEDVLLYNQKQGGANFDFYWTDWQQGGDNGGCNGYQLNPTFITDHVRWSSMMRRNETKRGNNFARFGGLGAHRYPVGFTGDVSSLSWECFAYQPYFSVTASNVGYNPSHDLVGPYNDHELHVRWMQFGAFSGVMRIHDRGMSSGSCWDLGVCAIVDIWTLPYNYFDAIRTAMTMRVALLPYIYRNSRLAYDEGLQFVHGLYYEWPTESNAYNLGPQGKHAQYMFGEDIVVAIVTSAADKQSGLASLSTWVPPGEWYDNVFGDMLTGPQTITRQYLLADVPMLIRAGAVIPRLHHAHEQGIAGRAFAEIDWYIYPSSKDKTGSGSLYEDDGETFGYIAGDVAWTNCSYTRPSGSDMSIVVSPAQGPFSSKLPATRHSRFYLVSASPVQSASCAGKPAKYNQDGGADTWRYGGDDAQVIVDCGHQPTSSPFTVAVSFISDCADGTAVAGAKGYATRTLVAKHLLDERQETPGSHNAKAGFTKQAGAHAGLLKGLAPTATAASWAAVVGSNYRTVMQNAINELSGNPGPSPPAFPAMSSLIQLFDDERHDMALCGSKDCMSTNNYYRVMWVEGYQPAANSNGAVKLNDYWNGFSNDNWADTTTKTPNGYSNAVFTDGWVLNSQQSGKTSSVCLQVWLKNTDHMTVASQIGVDYAKKNGYHQVENCIGWVLAQPLSTSSSSSSSSSSTIYADAFLELQLEKVREQNLKELSDAFVTAKELMDRVEKKQEQLLLVPPQHVQSASAVNEKKKKHISMMKRLFPAANKKNIHGGGGGGDEKKPLVGDAAKTQAIEILKSAMN